MTALRGVRAAAACAVLCVGGVGCSAFRGSVAQKEPAQTAPLGAKYDQEDLLNLAKEMTEAILAHPFPAAGENKPVLVALGIENRSKTHVDTAALSDTIMTKLIDSGRIRAVDSSRRDALLREQKYQQEHSTPDSRVALGRQLGARYMLTGSLIEIERKSGKEVRVSRQQDVYYQLTVQVTDVETGLVVLQKQKDRLRRASKPLIGW